MVDLISKNYSGIIINQNQYNDSTTALTVSQSFYLPNDFKRGGYIPSLTGFQVKINTSTPNTASVNYSLSCDSITLTSGVESKCIVDSNGDGWFDIRFESVDIDSSLLNSQFTLNLNFSNIIKIYKSSSDITYRVLASVADNGVDFLSNSYRSVVVNKTVDSVTTQGQNSNYWMSKPNPSEFGVESLYFEVGGNPIVIDSVYLDPVTPNVYFHVYYSNDNLSGFTMTDLYNLGSIGDKSGSPINGWADDYTMNQLLGHVDSDDDWDNLMWTPVRQTFKATKKQNYVFPEPIFAKYIKVEFSHLQARNYSGGLFHKPIKYKKHPKWILDYFMVFYNAKRNKTYDAIIGQEVSITYDALDLAYNYYKDDIFISSNGIDTVGLANYNAQYATNILTNVSDYNNLSGDILNQIKLSFQNFESDPVIQSDKSTVIGKIASSRAASDINRYAVENSLSAKVDTSIVSTLDREPLILEKNFPVMHFYLTCRHGYREALAKFEQNKAYFVGINEIAFQRDLHQVPYDAQLYIESTGDDQNVAVNDFDTTSNGWVIA